MKEWEQRRAYKGEREEGLTLKRDDVEGWGGAGGWRWIQKWTEAMNEVRLMKGLSVLQFLTLMAPVVFSSRGLVCTISPQKILRETRSIPAFFFFFFLPCPNSSLFVLYSTNKLGLYSTCGLIQSSARRHNICLAPRRGAEIIIVMAFRAINTARRRALFRRRREKSEFCCVLHKKGTQ